MEETRQYHVHLIYVSRIDGDVKGSDYKVFADSCADAFERASELVRSFIEVRETLYWSVELVGGAVDATNQGQGIQGSTEQREATKDRRTLSTARLQQGSEVGGHKRRKRH